MFSILFVVRVCAGLVPLRLTGGGVGISLVFAEELQGGERRERRFSCSPGSLRTLVWRWAPVVVPPSQPALLRLPLLEKQEEKKKKESFQETLKN